MFKNKILIILSLIAIVNAIGYGIIIPLIYGYSKRFGLSVFDNGLLFALYSLCQFLSAPLIGRLSDKYGRKWLLSISIAGTALSFFMAAYATNAFWFFMSRALDGITAGNFPVAAAVISDSLEPKDRAKGFGLLGASFNLGFVLGPAISGFTVGISPTMPFIIAGFITVLATVITVIFLPETNKHKGQVSHGKLFDIPKLFHSLFDKNLGITFLISLIYAFTFSIFVYIFQPYGQDILHMSLSQTSFFFTGIGIIGVIVQSLIIGKATKVFGLKNALSMSLLVVTISFLGTFFFKNLALFLAFGFVFAFANALINPLIQTILSSETDEKSQGSMQGLNSSYMSIGQILGPIIGAVIAIPSVTYPFLGAGIFSIICLLLSFQVLKPHSRKQSAF